MSRKWAVLALMLSMVSPAEAGIEDVRRSFDEVAADPTRMAVYCEMSAYIASTPGEIDEAKIAAYLAVLGPRFAAAWEAGDQFASEADAKLYDAALEALFNRCPRS